MGRSSINLRGGPLDGAVIRCSPGRTVSFLAARVSVNPDVWGPRIFRWARYRRCRWPWTSRYRFVRIIEQMMLDNPGTYSCAPDDADLDHLDLAANLY